MMQVSSKMFAQIALQLAANVGVQNFDGRSWMGLELNRTTRSEIQEKFTAIQRNQGESALHIQTDGTAVVDLLMDDDRASSRLRAIRLELKGKSRFDLLPVSTPNVLFPVHRYENWYLWTWPERGIAAVVLNGKMLEVLLTSPNRMPLLNAGFTNRPTPISEPPYVSNVGKKTEGQTGDAWTDSISEARQKFTSADWRKMLPPRQKDSCDDSEYRLIVNAYVNRESAGFYASPAPFRWSLMEEVYENLVIPIDPDR